MASAATSGAPLWLFSFVDLAFLLLIAMTQLGDRQEMPELGELIVPRVRAEAAGDLPPGSARLWQLRVHPPEEASSPFELVRGELVSQSRNQSENQRLELEVLRERVRAIRTRDEPKPLLAPHADSRSQDLLDALDVLEDLWPSRRRATVSTALAQQ